MQYNTENDTLIRSDIEELRGESEPISIDGGSQKALILEFNLPTSSYATMALREILKCDTSVAHQVQLQQSTDDTSKQTQNETESHIEAKKPKIDVIEQAAE